MIKILFICHGNICRSPMAEFVFKDMTEKKGLSGLFQIDSAGTSREELGNGVHPGTRRELQKHGISCSGKTARPLTGKDYDAYDCLIAMDSANMRNIERITGHDRSEGKIRRLLSYAVSGKDIADPWYTGDFAKTYRDVLAGCRGLLKEIEEQRLL